MVYVATSFVGVACSATLFMGVACGATLCVWPIVLIRLWEWPMAVVCGCVSKILLIHSLGDFLRTQPLQFMYLISVQFH